MNKKLRVYNMAGEISGSFVKYEDYCKLQSDYDELNDFSKSECKKLLLKNEELKKQIEQLSNDNHVLKTAFITQKEQIEKMKCCGNCKLFDVDVDGGGYCTKDYNWKNKIDTLNDYKIKKCDKWESAE